jgi:hypothetical protein
MAGVDMQNVILIALVLLVALFLVYQYNPYLFSSFGMYEGFEESAEAKAKAEKEKAEKAKAEKEKAEKAKAEAKAKQAPPATAKFTDMHAKEGFADLNAYQGPAQFGSADAPAGCYPRDQLTPSELLPKDMNSVWAEQNPMGAGSLKGKNFLSAGALIGVNTVGQSMRNANLQVRSEPPCPQMAVSIFNQSTISPDISHRPLEIGA